MRLATEPLQRRYARTGPRIWCSRSPATTSRAARSDPTGIGRSAHRWSRSIVRTRSRRSRPRAGWARTCSSSARPRCAIPVWNRDAAGLRDAMRGLAADNSGVVYLDADQLLSPDGLPGTPPVPPVRDRGARVPQRDDRRSFAGRHASQPAGRWGWWLLERRVEVREPVARADPERELSVSSGNPRSRARSARRNATRPRPTRACRARCGSTPRSRPRSRRPGRDASRRVGGAPCR